MREAKLQSKSGQSRRATPPGEPNSSVVGCVDRALADGSALKRWWQQKDAAGDYAARFELMRSFNAPDRAIGFFDVAPLSAGPVPVMGLVQELAYDSVKEAPLERVCAELREFVLRYFMRVSSFHEPQAWVEQGTPSPASYRPGISWCPQPEAQRVGFGYSQLYYKRQTTAEVAAFPHGLEHAIVDLRDIGPVYDWLMARVRIFDFQLTFHPFGRDSLSFVIPLKEHNYIVLSRDFIADRQRPEPGVLGEYGFGYALLRDPAAPGVFAYGPGQLGTGFQLIDFRVLDDGQINARLVFVVNRPARILNVTIDPAGWAFGLTDLVSFGAASRFFSPVKRALDRLPWRVDGLDPLLAYVRLANAVTGGSAAADWCVSKEQLEKDFLVTHFRQHYQMVVGSLLTWRRVSNWLDPNALPAVALTGVGA